MKQKPVPTWMTIGSLILGLVGLVGANYAAADDTPEQFSVTAQQSPEEAVKNAQHKIAMIQGDPGYYYSGAAGALHRINDVQVQKDIISKAQDSNRFPASTK